MLYAQGNNTVTHCFLTLPAAKNKRIWLLVSQNNETNLHGYGFLKEENEVGIFEDNNSALIGSGLA